MSDFYIDTAGGTYTGKTFGKRCIFEGATFYAACTFGEGCIFKGCKFLYRQYQPYSITGKGCIFDGCSINWCTIGSESTVKLGSLGAVSMGGGVRINPSGVAIGSGVSKTYNHCLGEQLAGDEFANHDWCSYRCSKERYLKIGGMTCASVTVEGK